MHGPAHISLGPPRGVHPPSGEKAEGEEHGNWLGLGIRP